MKHVEEKLIPLLASGNCTPQIAGLAKKTGEPSTTIHYNIKKLEREGAIKAYKAVFNHKKINQGFCAYVLINLAPMEYADPDKIARDLAKHPEVESVDICTGDWEIVIKVHTKDMDAYYDLVKRVISRKGVIKINSLTSMNQVKTEFVTL